MHTLPCCLPKMAIASTTTRRLRCHGGLVLTSRNSSAPTHHSAMWKWYLPVRTGFSKVVGAWLKEWILWSGAISFHSTCLQYAHTGASKKHILPGAKHSMWNKSTSNLFTFSPYLPCNRPTDFMAADPPSSYSYPLAIFLGGVLAMSLEWSLDGWMDGWWDGWRRWRRRRGKTSWSLLV